MNAAEHSRERNRRRRQDPEKRAHDAAVLKRWEAEHREERRAYHRARRQHETPEQRESRLTILRRDSRGYYLKRVYGVTVEEFDALVAAQDGRCAICQREGRLVLDHDHRTLRRRRLLCSQCNSGLGFFADNPDRLEAAATYLRTHRPASETKLAARLLGGQ